VVGLGTGNRVGNLNGDGYLDGLLADGIDGLVALLVVGLLVHPLVLRRTSFFYLLFTLLFGNVGLDGPTLLVNLGFTLLIYLCSVFSHLYGIAHGVNDLLAVITNPRIITLNLGEM